MSQLLYSGVFLIFCEKSVTLIRIRRLPIRVPFSEARVSSSSFVLARAFKTCCPPEPRTSLLPGPACLNLVLALMTMEPSLIPKGWAHQGLP